MTAVWDPKMCAKLVKTIPLGRKFGEPDDISEAIIFLASDKAKYISGEILDVNGAAWCD
jgi:NAD(P)-dependent dehydrogenase (short-subunit alcohol dehydrogenase family)